METTRTPLNAPARRPTVIASHESFLSEKPQVTLGWRMARPLGRNDRQQTLPEHWIGQPPTSQHSQQCLDRTGGQADRLESTKQLFFRLTSQPGLKAHSQLQRTPPHTRRVGLKTPSKLFLNVSPSCFHRL